MFSNIQFSSFGEFLQMGGYAFNVWSVYALFLLFFFINLYLPLSRKRQIIRDQKRRQLFNEPKGSTASTSTGQDSEAVGETP